MRKFLLYAGLIWTFKPFSDLTDANKFTDALPVTANAKIFYGKANTPEEIKESKKIHYFYRNDQFKWIEVSREKYRELIRFNPSEYIDRMGTMGPTPLDDKDRWIVRYQIEAVSKTAK